MTAMLVQLLLGVTKQGSFRLQEEKKMLMAKLREAHSAASVQQPTAASDAAQHAEAAGATINHVDRSEAEDQSVAGEAFDMRRASSKGICS